MKQRKSPTVKKEPMIAGQKLPFQMKHSEGYTPIELAKAAFPIFGGTAPGGDGGAGNDGGDSGETEKKNEQSGSGGSGSNPTGGDQLTPEQIAAIVANNATLQEKLGEVNSKLETYTKAEEQAEKAKLGEVERRDREIQERDQTIQQMDSVIRSLAVENAIAQNKELRFHKVSTVIHELDPTEYEIDVDLKTGQATVTNLDKALKRIADSNPWMLVQDQAIQNPGNGSQSKTGNQNPGGTKRGSGAPPAPGAPKASEGAQRRAELIKKYPVLAAGRAR